MSKKAKTSAEIVADGRAAGELLQHPVLLDAFATAEEQFLTEMRNGRTTDEREKAWHLLQALDALKSRLNAAVLNGKLVERREGGSTL